MILETKGGTLRTGTELNEIRNERLMGVSEASEMLYFYDPHHYKPSLGDKILETVLNETEKLSNNILGLNVNEKSRVVPCPSTGRRA
ncbi:MAG: hypothetical protein ACKVQC_03120 [Elusimicrobiota bacterium]